MLVPFVLMESFERASSRILMRSMAHGTDPSDERKQSAALFPWKHAHGLVAVIHPIAGHRRAAGLANFLRRLLSPGVGV